MKDEIIKEIIIKVFDVARQHCSKNSINALSIFIEQEIEKSETKEVSSKTIARHYDAFVNSKGKKISPDEAIINSYCNFLGYGSYKDYVEKGEFNFDKSKINKKPQNMLTSKNEVLTKKTDTKNKHWKAFSIVIFTLLLVLATFLYLLKQQLFNATVTLIKNPTISINNDYPKLNINKNTVLQFYFPNGIIEKELNSKNEVVITDLPQKLYKEKIKVNLKDEYWKLAKNEIVIKNGVQEIYIEPNEKLSKIEGLVLSQLGGLPIANVKVKINDIEVRTNENGVFSAVIPYEKRKQEYNLSLYKEGYKSYTKTYYPGSRIDIRLSSY